MNRRNFLKSAVLSSSVLFIPNAVLAFGDELNNQAKLDPQESFFIEPNLKDYKFNTDGTAFFQTKVGFRLDELTNVWLPKEFRLSHETNGYGTPAFYSKGSQQYVFVSELFLGSKMNGWIYEYDTEKGFTAHRAFQHKNMGWYAFWGKPVNDKPALYHFNYNGFYVTQTAFLDGKWQTNRIYNTVPEEAIRLYQSQVNHPDYPHQTNQFGFEWQVHPDGVYDFLKLKHSWEEDKLEIFKNGLEEQERQNPTVLSSLECEQMTRVFRNRQCLANVDENCDCDMVAQTADSDLNNLRIVKTQNLTKGKVEIFDKETVYETKLGFYDERNVYHEIPETLHCAEDVLGQKKPVLFGNGTNYYLTFKTIENKIERQFLYRFNQNKSWHKEEISVEQDWGKIDLAILANSENPIIFQNQQPTESPANFIKAKFSKTESFISSASTILNELLLQQTQTGVTNPFIPIYCEGDDLKFADPKPTIIYQEVAGTKIEIPNMPAYKTQNELGECRAFSVAALMQWYTCFKWKDEIPDCKNPPDNRAISYFGMMIYTHRDLEIEKTLQPEQKKVEICMRF